MKSCVHEFVCSLRVGQRRSQRKDVFRGVIGLRLTVRDTELLRAFSARYNMPVTTMAALLLGEAVNDAAYQVGLLDSEGEAVDQSNDLEE